MTQNVMLTILLIIAVIFVFVLEAFRKEEQERDRIIRSVKERRDDEKHARDHAALRNYESARNDLWFVRKSSAESVSRLFDSLKQAERELDTAECEFLDGAFAPFWDATEESVGALESAERAIKHITGDASKYGSVIK